MYFQSSYVYSIKDELIKVKLIKKTEKGRYMIIKNGKKINFTRDQLAKLLGCESTYHFSRLYAKHGIRMFTDINVFIKSYYIKKPQHMSENRFITTRLKSTNFS